MIGRDDHNGKSSAGTVAIGSGWLVPATMLFVFVTVAYLPTHPIGNGVAGLIAAIGAFYVVAILVVLPRLVRGFVLRRGGLGDPIVLLGHASDVLERATVPPLRRLAAVASGLLVTMLATVGSILVTGGAASGTYSHAVGSLALAANLALLLGSLMPIPGFGGWAVLLALADLRPAGPDGRVGQAAIWARTAALGLVGGSVILGFAVGDVMVVPIGLLLAVFAWRAAGTARGVDVAKRFFARHSAADLARPLTAVRQADDRLAELGPEARDAPALVLDGHGALVGVVGPRQLEAALRGESADHRCSDVMVPIRALTIIGGTAPASALLPGLTAHGFAVVRSESGIAAADADDVGRQLRIWSLVAGWGQGRKRSSPGADGTDALA